jgi:trk system potassium uptake protein TrkA
VFVLIAGGEPVGLQLAKFLLAQHHEVCLIENRQPVIERIHHKLPTEVVIEGFMTDLDLLEKAGIRRANVMAACTPNDTDNLALCYLARTLFECARSVGLTIRVMPGFSIELLQCGCRSE